MDRRDFIKKVGKGVLVIIAARTIPALFPHDEANACASDSTCSGCLKSKGCTLPKYVSYINRKQE